MRAVIIGVLGSVATGCVADDVTLAQTEEALIKKPGDDCESYGCGQNSPETEGYLFYDQHEGGQPNSQNIYVESFSKHGIAYDPDVQTAQLLGLDKVTHTPVLKGSDLIGARFTLRNRVTLEHYYVVVTWAGEMAMWTKNPAYTWSYELTYWSDSNPTRRNLCNAAGQPTNDPMDPFKAVLFDDDRIDPDTITFRDEEPGWFTIGCAGSALAKAHLSGHTKAGSTIANVTTTTRQRTAFIKMITADYCGTGGPFTVAGTDLHYRDAQGVISTVVPNEKIEALWTEAGATCVNTPRVIYSPTTLSQTTFAPDLQTHLDAWGCKLPPPCTATTYGRGFSFAGALVVSTNY